MEGRVSEDGLFRTELMGGDVELLAGGLSHN